MNLLNKLKLKYLWPYLLVVLAIILPWFLKFGYLFFTDMVWGPQIKLDWTSSWFLFSLLRKSLSLIFSVALLEKIFIGAVILLILLAGRALVKAILNYYSKAEEKVSRGLVFILSLFTLFNPFVYDRALYGQFGILIAYAFLLFTISYLFKAWSSLDFKNMLWAAVFSALVLMFSVHFIFLLSPFVLLFLVGLFLKRKKIKTAGKWKKFWLNSFFAFLIILILNANWLIALAVKASPTANFVDKGITSQDLVAFQTAGKDGLETLTNVLMMSGFWGKEQFRYLDLTDFSGWQMSFIFLLPIILYGLYLSFKRPGREAKAFSLALLITFVLVVFLAVGIKTNLTRGFTLLLYDHLPLYKGLREPQKWVAVIIPIYLFFLSLGAWRLSKTKIIIRNRFVSGLILMAVIIMLAPSLIWGFNRQVKPTPYPDDWYELDNLLLEKSNQASGCSDKILFLPWHMYLSFGWTGKIISNPAKTFFSCPVISGTNMEWGGIYDNSQNTDGQAIANWLSVKGGEARPIVSGEQIRYIVLAKELDFVSYFWLNDLSYIEPLLETKTLIVYEIKD